ncbi:MAG: tetratricopeptide repeat protein [Gaiellaceae bacterium]
MPRQKSTHVDSPRAVGERLKAAREASGLSQRQLSFPGCSPAYISRIESGERIPSLQLLRELGRRLGVSEDYLATGAAAAGELADALVEAEVALRLGDLEEAERGYTAALEQGGGDVTRAGALEGLGQVAFRAGDPRLAIERFEDALALYGSDESTHSDLADSLGRSYAMVGELESAIGVFERCLEAAEGAGDMMATIQFSVLLGHTLIDSGNFGRAEELLGRALALGKDSQNPSVLAHLYWTQSRLHAERNSPETAARYARRALEVLRLTEDTYRTARAHQLLAHIELDRGNAHEALDLLEEGWPLLEASANRLERAQYRLEEARALAKVGRSEEAAALAMQISGLIADAHPEDAARSYSVLAGVFGDLGDRGRARELYELAADLLEPRNPSRYLIDVYSRLAELAEAEGRKEEAYELMKKAIGMQKAVAEKAPS